MQTDIHPTTRALDELETLCRGMGHHDPDRIDGYAIDFNNDILADPYLFGTGYLPTREDAETFAALVLPILDALGAAYLADDPDQGLGYTNPELVATESYAVIVSAERNPWGGDPNGGDPVHEETYFGDAWLVAGTAVPFTLTDDERERLDRVRALLRGIR